MLVSRCASLEAFSERRSSRKDVSSSMSFLSWVRHLKYHSSGCLTSSNSKRQYVDQQFTYNSDNLYGANLHEVSDSPGFSGALV